MRNQLGLVQHSCDGDDTNAQTSGAVGSDFSMAFATVILAAVFATTSVFVLS